MSTSTYGGQEYQHASIDLRINLPGVAPIKAITFKKLSGKVTLTKKPTNDSQGNITGYTIDKKVIDASVTLRLSEYRVIRTQLVRVGSLLVPPLGPLQIAMDWTVSFGNTPTNIRTDAWQGVLLQVDPFDSSDDQSELDAEIPLFVTDIVPETAPSMIYRPY